MKTFEILMPKFVPLQENWDHVLKTWKSSSLISDFINSVISPVHWRLDFWLCCSSHFIITLVTLALFLSHVLTSSPPRRKLLRLPSSLLPASNPHSREHWSRASRGCGSVQGGSRASGLSPTLARQCRSCCRPRRKHVGMPLIPGSCSSVCSSLSSPHVNVIEKVLLGVVLCYIGDCLRKIWCGKKLKQWRLFQRVMC